VTATLREQFDQLTKVCEANVFFFSFLGTLNPV
jgi:hypothetical protein